MYENFGFENLTAPQAAVWFALALGVMFGALAQVLRFCFRRAIVGQDRMQAGTVWATALLSAFAGTQFAIAQGWISFAEHRFLSPDLPVLAVLLGGLLFGAGMVLTRGCVARLSVLGASGNLRAVLVLIVFAIIAHAAMKGVLAPLRAQISAFTVPLNTATLPGPVWVWGLALAALTVALIARSRVAPMQLLGAISLGALVPLAWVGTGFVLYDDFDPIAMQGLAFTAPMSEALFFAIASTSIPAGFGAALIGGTLLGALFSALLRGEFQWQSFEAPRQTGRYLAGAALMGIGGVLAGGCTVGAGLSGVPTLSIAAVLALGAIALGARLMQALLNGPLPVSVGSTTTPTLQPAE